jgi:hypothetical protein
MVLGDGEGELKVEEGVWNGVEGYDGRALLWVWGMMEMEGMTLVERKVLGMMEGVADVDGGWSARGGLWKWMVEVDGGGWGFRLMVVGMVEVMVQVDEMLVVGGMLDVGGMSEVDMKGMEEVMMGGEVWMVVGTVEVDGLLVMKGGLDVEGMVGGEGMLIVEGMVELEGIGEGWACWTLWVVWWVWGGIRGGGVWRNISGWLAMCVSIDPPVYGADANALKDSVKNRVQASKEPIRTPVLALRNHWLKPLGSLRSWRNRMWNASVVKAILAAFIAVLYILRQVRVCGDLWPQVRSAVRIAILASEHSVLYQDWYWWWYGVELCGRCRTPPYWSCSSIAAVNNACSTLAIASRALVDGLRACWSKFSMRGSVLIRLA